MIDLDELQAQVRGHVLLPSDPGFKEALNVWAVAPTLERFPEPALVVQPRGVNDVQAAIKWAVKRGMPVAAKCGGHGGGNPSLVDGGMVIHLGLMRSVYVDPLAKTAVVDGGCLAADVDAETSVHGLALPLGACPTVGIGGLGLQGGLSLLSRAFGATCDSILEAQIVLADGSVLNVDETSDPDMFWAVRGGGTVLGIVTKIKFRLYDVSDAYCGTMVWKDDADHMVYRGIMRFIRDTVFPDTRIGFNIARAVHPELGPILISMVVVLGEASRQEKDGIIQPLRDLTPLQDTVGQSTWRQTQSTHGPAIAGLKAACPVHYECWCGGHIEADKFTDEFMDAWLNHSCDALPMPECAITLSFLELAGGKLKQSAGPVGITADVQWITQVGWADPSSHGTAAAFAQQLREAMAPYTSATSSYINLDDVAEMPELTHRQAAARLGGTQHVERLRAIKARVDPDNLFCHTPHARVLAAEAEADALAAER